MDLSLETTHFTKAADIVIPDIFYKRIKTNFHELDFGFGGGLLPGSSITLTAKAGAGKTTFLLQMCDSLGKNGYDVGYASGEENMYQLAFNCDRLNTKNVQIANETDVDKLVESTKQYDVLVVDSFQALTVNHDLKVKEKETYAINSLVTAAKNNECVIFFVMHLTKAGVLKGSSLIPHIVDVNMQINPDKESGDVNARIVSIVKNRFGPSMEYNCVLSPTGFVFTIAEENGHKPLTKKQRNQDNINQVLAMTGEITKYKVITDLKLSPAQAYVLLKNMCDCGQLIKVGRGEDSYFEVVK